MRLSRKYAVLIILIAFMFSGCTTLTRVPGALIGGTFKLIGSALSIAKKLPWWIWV